MIELKNIVKTYGTKEARVLALNGVNLKIEEGEFVAIIGPSGSGKSTLLNILGVIDSPSSGVYNLKSKQVSSLSNKEMAHLRNKEFGFVLQYFGLINDYTVYENIALTLKYSKKKIKNKRQLIRETLKKLSIEDKENSYPTELSGGQCQRVAIARALINDPKNEIVKEGLLDGEVEYEGKCIEGEWKIEINTDQDTKVESKVWCGNLKKKDSIE